MRREQLRHFLHGTLASAWVVTWFQVAMGLASPPVDPERAMARTSIETRMAAYADLRAQTGARVVRADARQGDIFATAVAALLGTDVRQPCGSASRRAASGDFGALPEYALMPVVNQPLPSWAMEAVSQEVLARLPIPPSGIAYRVVDCTLVLWDGRAGIVVDALPDAFRPSDGLSRAGGELAPVMQF